MLRNTLGVGRTLNSRLVGLNSIRLASTQAISNATIMDINKRWETMPNTEQEELVAKLTERQKLPWKELTQNEKQAAWYISYGEWGPRRPVHALSLIHI